MLALTHRHMVEPPLFLPLAARCFGLMAQSVPPRPPLRVQAADGRRACSAPAPASSATFPSLPPGGGVALLRHSYALIIGLWQMSARRRGVPSHARWPAPARRRSFAWRYPDELERALRALWQRHDRRARRRRARVQP